MTLSELRALVDNIDSRNAEYIMKEPVIIRVYERINRYAEQGNNDLLKIVSEDLERYISEYDSHHLTPANARVGDGATVNLWSDRHAGTIIKVTKRTIVIRRDKAILDPNFKPNYIPGGFSVHCTNSHDQKWSYEPDEDGDLTTLYWSEKYRQYGRPGNLTASKGRHEYYDYNF